MWVQKCIYSIERWTLIEGKASNVTNVANAYNTVCGFHIIIFLCEMIQVSLADSFYSLTSLQDCLVPGVSGFSVFEWSF